VTVAAQDGTEFTSLGVNAPRNLLDTGASITAQATPDLQIYGSYDIAVGFGTSTDQAISAGLKYRF
jgi:outer membrane autotransporter protein